MDRTQRWRAALPHSGRARLRTPPAGHDVEHTISPLPIVATAAARCATPIIVLELDVDAPITVEAEDVLASMLDPRANSRWIDQDQRTILDLSYVS